MHSTASSFYGSMVQAGYMEPFGKFPLPKFQCIYFQALCQQRARLGNHPRKISARRHTRKGFTAKKTTGLPEILEQVLLLVPPPLLLDLVPMLANSIPPCWPSWLGACTQAKTKLRLHVALSQRFLPIPFWEARHFPFSLALWRQPVKQRSFGERMRIAIIACQLHA